MRQWHLKNTLHTSPLSSYADTPCTHNAFTQRRHNGLLKMSKYMQTSYNSTDKFLVCVNIHGNKAHSDSELTEMLWSSTMGEYVLKLFIPCSLK